MQKYRGIENKAVEDGQPCEGPSMESKPCQADCVGNVMLGTNYFKKLTTEHDTCI